MIIRRLAQIVGVAVCFVVACPVIFADETGGPAATDGREATIRATANRYLDARRRGDASAVLAFWLPDGIYVDAQGRSFSARQLIPQQFKKPSEESTYEPEADDRQSTIHFIAANVAMEKGRSSGPNSGSFAAIWVKQDQDWLLASVQDWPPSDDATDNPLNELAWLIGDWVAIVDDQQVDCSVRWSENKRFIILKYSVAQGDRRVNAVQRIGWDAAARRVRSWTFDSDGGIVEDRWHRESDAWIVKTNGVLSDGARSSSVVFWIPDGPDRIVRRTTHAVVDEAKVDDTVLEFQRSTN